jgi:hypothetical protein
MREVKAQIDRLRRIGGAAADRQRHNEAELESPPPGSISFCSIIRDRSLYTIF